MVLANITFFVRSDAADAFRDWATDTLMPAMAAEGFTHILLCYIGEDADQGHHTFALQHRAASREAVQHWAEGAGRDIFADMQRRFGTDGVLMMHTVMDILLSAADE